MMKNSLLLCAIGIVFCFLSPQKSLAKDPVFAVPVSVPLFAVGDENDKSIQFATFSIVNALWLRYLTGVPVQSNINEGKPTIFASDKHGINQNQPKKIFVSIISTPQFLTFVDSYHRHMNYSNDESIKVKIIHRTFLRVINDYMVNYFGLKNVDIVNGYDEEGVRLQMFPGIRSLVFFNRTFVISFDDPPYGQSLSNRLVTNRNINWIVNEVDLIGIDEAKRASGNDLMYRYYHNIGHALGFGHYRSSAVQKDIHILHNRTEYIKYLSSIEKISSTLPANERISQSILGDEEELRSVMYANISNSKKSAGFPTNMDRYVFRYVAINFNELINKFITDFIVNELSPLILSMINVARYFTR